MAFGSINGGALSPSPTFGPPRRITSGELLPKLTRKLISADDRLILAFVLAYLKESEDAGVLGNVSLHISGGYVRDLLLGRASTDLDLTLCLRSCEPHVTVNTVVARMPDFAMRRPELAIERVEIVTALSDAARSKTMDSAAVRMLIRGEWVLVDVLPTIGQETYDESDRIPQRDCRGTVEDDTLRRDLTIGAMLLEVTQPEKQAASLRAELAASLERRLAAEFPDGPADIEAGAEPMDSESSEIAQCMRAAEAASSLQFRLIDFHGGLADLNARLLRAPVPKGRTLPQVRDQVLRTREEREMAAAIGIGTRGYGPAGLWARPPNVADGDLAAADELQAVWWIKTLRDDPLRLVRALRFAASLGFRVHPAFWSAVPFAVDALRNKVSGARKVNELRKIAAAGRPALIDFFEMAFAPLARFGEDVAFGDALFGGPDDDPDERLSIVAGFDPVRLRRAGLALPNGLSDDASIGAVLGASLFSCELRPCDYDAGLDDPCRAAGGLDDEAAAAATISRAEAERACDGLCASTSMRQAATEPLAIIADLISRRLYPPGPLGHHALFAASANLNAGSGEGGECCFDEAKTASYAPVDFADAADAANVASLVHSYEVLKLDPSLAHRRLEVTPDFVLALMRTRCAADTSAFYDAQLRLLRQAGPTISGSAVAQLKDVPPHLRGQIIANVHVLCRLRGEAPMLETAEALEEYLEGRCGGLLTKLRREWWGAEPGAGEDDEEEGKARELRPMYTKAAIQEWQRSQSGGVV